MRFIKTLKDIQTLKNSNILNKGYIERLEEYFMELAETLDENDDIEAFSLQPYGYIVILEHGDNLRDLSEVGLNPEYNGLLGISPEFVNIVKIGSLKFYQIGILYDNEYMIVFFSIVGQFDEEVENYLTEQAGLI